MNNNIVHFGAGPHADTTAEYARLGQVEAAAERLLLASQALLELTLNGEKPSAEAVAPTEPEA